MDDDLAEGVLQLGLGGQGVRELILISLGVRSNPQVTEQTKASYTASFRQCWGSVPLPYGSRFFSLIYGK